MLPKYHPYEILYEPNDFLKKISLAVCNKRKHKKGYPKTFE